MRPAEADPDKIATILDAAGQVFFEQGFSGARVDLIARRAGVNKAMLYYHVGDKKTLFNAVLVRNIDRALTSVRTAAAREGTHAERFRAVVGTFARMAAEADHISLVMREATAGGDNLTDEVLSKILELASVTSSVIGEGQLQGEFRALNPILGHLMMVASIIVLTVTRPMRARMETAGLARRIEMPATADELSAAVSDVLLHGIARTPDPDKGERK